LLNYNYSSIELTQKMNNKNTKTLGESVSDKVASAVGSWHFIIIQSTIIAIWIFVNTNLGPDGREVFGMVIKPWDPFPFIFLNLTLSFQAAYTAPIIMMSQNRQSKLDRKEAEDDYLVNRQAKEDVDLIKKELQMIHHKLLAHQEIQYDIEQISTDISSLHNIVRESKGAAKTN
jgi:uncharacterized membrane protein